jgi:hypothetical protein
MLENTWLKKAAGGGEGAGISRTRDERITVASTHLYSQAGAREGEREEDQRIQKCREFIGFDRKKREPP